MESLRVLTINSTELYFSAAHYIPDHPKCGVLHGHTYFVSALEVVVKGFVDLSAITDAIKTFDHLTLIPEEHALEWQTLLDIVNKTTELEPLRKVFSKRRRMVDTDLPGTTVERIAEELKYELEQIPGVMEAHFTLTEGPTTGCSV